MNSNSILDLFGLIFSFVGTAFCVGVVYFVQHKIDKVLPCEKHFMSSRMEVANANLHTALINALALFLLLIVKFQWFHARIDTAPVQIDAQILFLEATIILALCRSSLCSFRNVTRLLIFRKTDNPSGCVQNKKRLLNG